MFLRFCDLGVTRSWDDGLPGARASRPHQAWHSLGHLPHLHQPGTAPWLSFGLADAVPAHRVAASKAARKLSNHHTDQDAGGTPALPGGTPPLRGSRRRWLMRWGGQLTAGPPPPAHAYRRRHFALSRVCQVYAPFLSPHRLDCGLGLRDQGPPNPGSDWNRLLAVIV